MTTYHELNPVIAPGQPELAVHAGMLRRCLFVLGAAADRLDDLVQEIFVVALQKRLEVRGHGPVGALLRGVAENLLLRERRDAGRQGEVELADEVWRAWRRAGHRALAPPAAASARIPGTSPTARRFRRSRRCARASASS